jgi:hypothetical protein
MGLNRSVAMRRSLLIGGNYVNIDIAAYSDTANTAPYVNIEQGFFDDPPP